MEVRLNPLEHPLGQYLKITSYCRKNNLREMSNPVFWENKKSKSTFVISKSKGLSETLRNIRTSTYQICGTEEINKSNNHM